MAKRARSSLAKPYTDADLARDIHTVFERRSDELSLENGLKAFDRLAAIERRSPGAAKDAIAQQMNWLEKHGLRDSARRDEIKALVEDIRRHAKRRREAQVVETIESSGRSPGYDAILQPAGHIRQAPFDPPWSALEDDDAASLIEQLSPVDGNYTLSGQTLIAQCQLPWLDGARLLRVLNPDFEHTRLVLYYIDLSGGLFRLNGTSPPIHEVNAKAPINLTNDNVIDYLKFFCFFVRGDDGPFYFVERVDDPMLPEAILKGEVTIDGHIAPAELKGRDDQGYYRALAHVFYSNAIFEAEFAIQPGGMIEMINDDPLITDLPVKMDQPVS